MRNNGISRRQFLKGLSASIALLLSTVSGSLFPPGAQAQSPDTDTSSMQRYVCTVCGYVYDPSAGDPTSAIPPGTPFEKLPENWVCPDCGVTKSEFEVYT